MNRWLIQQFGRSLTPATQAFHAALDAPEVAQRSLQQHLCDRLIASEYGKSLGITGVKDWQRVPIVEYADLEPWMLPQNRLTLEPILFHEKTSGSSGAPKLIPYTRSLRRSFNQLFCIWAQDLIQQGVDFSTGKIYFCISPKLGESSNAALQDDSDYLDLWLRWLLRPFLVAPALGQLRDPAAFKWQLGLALLREERLETISIWSPSFLKVQLDYIQTHQQALAAALQRQISADRHQLLTQPTIPWTKVWSELKLISCWDSAQAADQATGLRSRFPGVLVQGKGLLATEAPLTVPLIAAQGSVPMLTEVFLEFETARKIYCLHELQLGQAATIVLSQKGGLTRYRLGDRVRVSHFYRNTPCLEFLGRAHVVSDLVGEKLPASFVAEVLAQLPLELAFFKSLVPVANPPHYILLLDAAENASAIATQLDHALCQSHHYRHARLLGQLTAAEVLVSRQIPDRLTQARLRSGCTWGDIKHSLLVTTPISPDLLTELQILTNG